MSNCWDALVHFADGKDNIFYFWGCINWVCFVDSYLFLAKICSSNDKTNQPDFGMEIPFGPYLALAALGYFFGLKDWIDPWFSWVGQFKCKNSLWFLFQSIHQ